MQLKVVETKRKLKNLQERDPTGLNIQEKFEESYVDPLKMIY